MAGDDGSARVQFSLWNVVDLSPNYPIRIHFDDLKHARTLTAADFFDEDEPVPVGPFETARVGPLRIVVELLDPSGRPVATGKLTLPLQSDWEYGVTVAVDDANPIDLCMGCRGSSSFAIEPGQGFPPQDSLYLVWGGNSISNPVYY